MFKITLHNMPDYIFTTKEELTEIVKTAISELIPIKDNQAPVIDMLDLEGVLELLSAHGYNTTKAQIYKFTSLGRIPFLKLGNKLLFSRREILDWLKRTPVRSKSKDDALKIIKNSMIGK